MGGVGDVLRVVVGAARLSSTRGTRAPVTTTSSTVSASPGFAGAGAPSGGRSAGSIARGATRSLGAELTQAPIITRAAGTANTANRAGRIMRNTSRWRERGLFQRMTAPADLKDEMTRRFIRILIR